MMNNKTISTQPESKVQRLKMPYCSMMAIKKLTGLLGTQSCEFLKAPGLMSTTLKSEMTKPRSGPENQPPLAQIPFEKRVLLDCIEST